MRISLKAKIVGLVVGVGVVTVLVMALLTLMGEKEVIGKVSGEMDQFIHDNINRITTDVIGLCECTNDLLLDRIGNKLDEVTTILQEAGGFELTEQTVDLEAYRPSAGEKVDLVLPRMTFKHSPVGASETQFGAVSPVDLIRERLGLDVAIYQRINDKGDMLLLDQAGDGLVTRQKGDILEKESNPEIQSILSGERVLKVVFTSQDFYLKGHLPLIGAGGTIIGMVSMGENARAMDYLRRAITSIKVGRTGYVFVLKGTGKDRGTYIMSKDSLRDGENIWDAQDAAGHYFIRAPIYRIVPFHVAAITYEEYPWKNPGDREARVKVAAMGYYKPWDWVIGAGTYRDDYYTARDKIEEAMDLMLWEIVLGGVIILALAVLVAWMICGRITGPLSEVMCLADMIAKGSLDRAKARLTVLRKSGNGHRRAIEPENIDEIGQLTRAFALMTEHLHTLIGQVRQSGFDVRGSATEISASARLLEQTVNDQAASTNEVAATSKEIAGRSSDLVGVINQVAATVNETAAMAREGRKGLEGMEEAMGRLMTGTTSISKKLTNISQKAINIGGIVTAIAKVADKTNLLSLNAAIEAEKAGESGLGFSVVAREIRRLADQTASSTTDIEHMVEQMQAAVSAGIMEMDKFVDEARQRAGEVGAISTNLAEIIDQVQGLTGQFEQVNQAASAQYVGAEEISKATALLRDAVEQTHDSLFDFNLAAEHLVQAVAGLQDEVSRFTVTSEVTGQGKEGTCENSGSTGQ